MIGLDNPPIVFDLPKGVAPLLPAQVRRVVDGDPAEAVVRGLAAAGRKPALKGAPGRVGVAAPARGRARALSHLAVPAAAGGHVHGRPRPAVDALVAGARLHAAEYRVIVHWQVPLVVVDMPVHWYKGV